MDFQTFITCLIAVTVLTVTPGLDTMLIIRNSVRGGRLDGTFSSLGICTGTFVHAIISALGISLILLSTAWAFTALKTAGALYLIWLGLGSIKVAFQRGEGRLVLGYKGTKRELVWYRSFREGFLSNVLNPKAIIFYMAFLPQFIDPAHPAITQALFVAALHFSVAMVYQCLLAALVEKAATWLERPGVNRLFNIFSGTIFILLGARLAMTE